MTANVYAAIVKSDSVVFIINNTRVYVYISNFFFLRLIA